MEEPSTNLVASSTGDEANGFRELLGQTLEQEIPQDEMFLRSVNLDGDGANTRITYKALLVQTLLRKACRGEIKAINILLDRLFGKPLQMSESKSMTMNVSYEEYLKKLALEDPEMLAPVGAVTHIDADPVFDSHESNIKDLDPLIKGGLL